MPQINFSEYQIRKGRVFLHQLERLSRIWHHYANIDDTDNMLRTLAIEHRLRTHISFYYQAMVRAIVL